MAKRQKKPKKPSFFARMAKRGREFKSLGFTLKNDPKNFPSELLSLVRRSVRTIWDARGGGLYAFGFVVTFIVLEIRMFFVDIMEADSVSGFFAEQVPEMLFKYIGESFQNTISAFVWPAHVIMMYPPWGLGFLIVTYLLFARFFKKPLERWLFGADDKSGEFRGQFT